MNNVYSRIRGFFYTLFMVERQLLQQIHAISKDLLTLKENESSPQLRTSSEKEHILNALGDQISIIRTTVTSQVTTGVLEKFPDKENAMILRGFLISSSRVLLCSRLLPNLHQPLSDILVGLETLYSYLTAADQDLAATSKQVSLLAELILKHVGAEYQTTAICGSFACRIITRLFTRRI